MKKVLRAIMGTALTLGLVGTLAVAGATKSSKGPITNGEFAVKLAETMKIKGPQGGFSQAGAIDALSKLGVKFGRADESLSEARLVSALAVLGINVRSARPSEVVSVEKAGRVLTTFGRELTRASADAGLVAAGGNGGDDFNNGNGKGGKFKRKANLSPGGKDE